MIEMFLRPPRTVGLVVADLVRACALLSVLAAAIWWTPVDAGVLALAFPGVLASRFVGLRGGADALVGLSVLLAAWSSVLELYERIAWWDIFVHFTCTGVLAALGYLALHRIGVLPGSRTRAWVTVALTLAIGLALSALWEIVEWVGHTFVSEEIFVAYDDTIGDMAAGAAGAAGAGALASRIDLLEPWEALP